MAHANLLAANTFEKQTEVVPTRGSGAAVEGNQLTFAMPPHSYQMVRLRLPNPTAG
jgi:alpha-L-arabinofuranosidase